MINMNNIEQVGVIGLGKLGMPLAALLADSGYQVIGVDTDSVLIEKLLNGNFYTNEPKVMDLIVVNKPKFKFTTEFSSLSQAKIVYIIVPTPSDRDGAFDNTFLLQAISKMLKCRNNSTDHLDIVIVSTVMPGTCEKIIKPFINHLANEQSFNSDLINVIYSPEFIALGSVVDNIKNPDFVLVGVEKEVHSYLHLEIQKSIHGHVATKILSFTESELTKLLINCYITMKISFANLIGEICDNVENANSLNISNSIGLDLRIGNKYLTPGLGFGGPCFPRDNEALIHFFQKFNLNHELAFSTILINNRQPEKIISRIREHLEKATCVRVYGVSYKIGSDVYERSQIIDVLNMISKYEVRIQASDPLIIAKPKELVQKIDWKVNLEDIESADLVITRKEYLNLIENFTKEKIIII